MISFLSFVFSYPVLLYSTSNWWVKSFEKIFKPSLLHCLHLSALSSTKSHHCSSLGHLQNSRWGLRRLLHDWFQLYMRMTSPKIARWISASLENVFRGLRTTRCTPQQSSSNKNINLGDDILYKLCSIMNSYVLLYLYVSACCGTIHCYVQAAEVNEDEAFDNVVFRASLMTMANEKAFPVGKLIILRKWFEKELLHRS